MQELHTTLYVMDRNQLEGAKGVSMEGGNQADAARFNVLRGPYEIDAAISQKEGGALSRRPIPCSSD